MAHEAYPLAWPERRPRSNRREAARFSTTFARAREEVSRQVQMLCGRNEKTHLVISTNLPLRRDGIPLAMTRQPEDPGVAVYFLYKGRETCFACDRWARIEENMQAIAKTIDALRGVARWGTGDMIDAAFKGFAALPPPSKIDWRDILQFRKDQRDPSPAEVKYRYQALRSVRHPDNGGSAEDFDAVQKAYDAAKTELGFE